MNKIDELIKQYCPNGVEYKGLGDVCQIEKGQQLNKNSLKDVGEFPVMNGGISPSGYWSEYNTDSNTIIISQGGASAGYTQFMTVKFWAGAHCYTVKPKEISNKYLYYFIKNNQNILMSNQYGAGIPALNKRTLEALRIPVPPLPVQEEIVRILDAFSSLEAELEAELEARKKQYEYYRNKLLTFDENTTEGGISWKMLSEICIRQKGTNITAGEMKELHKINAPIKIFAAGNTTANLDYGDIPDRDVITKTSIIVKSRGNIGFEYYDKPFSHKNEMWSYSANDNSINLKFVYYFLSNHIIEFQIKAKTGKLPQISTPDTDKFLIPIPQLEEQERIVAILDKFDALVNDISEGLPAELNARRQQYEYYRNKLLTFSPLESEMN